MAGTAEVMGTDLSQEALSIFVKVLAPMDDRTIKQALERTALEVRGYKGTAPRLLLRDVLERAGIVSEAEAEELEGIMAWDFAESLADRFGFYNSAGEVVIRRRVSKAVESCELCSGSGWKIEEKDGKSFAEACGCRAVEEVPEISERIAGTVRRLGGWGVLKNIEPDRHAFVRRDFLLEFGRWTKLESFRTGDGGELVNVGKIAAGSTKGETETILDTILRSA